MEIDNKYYCDECKKENKDFLWQAKDGREYCDSCYDKVFYPKWYGFSRSDFINGKAGWTVDENGKTVKIHD